jgi:hypothetical protein
MHYHAEIWLPESVGKSFTALESRGELSNLIANMLERYSENADVNEGSGSEAFYDWYEVGGRCTGRHDHYHGWEDPINMEVCDLCRGTGVRTDNVAAEQDGMKATRGCNGCHGDGVKVKYSYAPHAQDVMALKDVRADLECYTVIIARNLDEPEIHHIEKWNGSDFVKTGFTGDNIPAFLKEQGITDGYLVTLDYHC